MDFLLVPSTLREVTKGHPGLECRLELNPLQLTSLVHSPFFPALTIFCRQCPAHSPDNGLNYYPLWSHTTCYTIHPKLSIGMKTTKMREFTISEVNSSLNYTRILHSNQHKLSDWVDIHNALNIFLLQTLVNVTILSHYTLPKSSIDTTYSLYGSCDHIHNFNPNFTLQPQCCLYFKIGNYRQTLSHTSASSENPTHFFRPGIIAVNCHSQLQNKSKHNYKEITQENQTIVYLR